MKKSPDSSSLLARRDFVKTTGAVAGVSALAGVRFPHVFAAGSDQIQVALVGCGGRGTGAARNALSQKGSPKLVAMADVFQHKLNNSYNSLSNAFKDRWMCRTTGSSLDLMGTRTRWIV